MAIFHNNYNNDNNNNISFIDPLGKFISVFNPLCLLLILTTHARSSRLQPYGARGPTPDLMPVPCSGVLTGVVAGVLLLQI